MNNTTRCNLISFLLLSISVTLFFSCTKNNEDTVENLSYEELIIGKWEVVSDSWYSEDNENDYYCKKGSQLLFSKDKTWKYKRDELSGFADRGPYTIEENLLFLYLSTTSSNAHQYTIEQFNSNKMILSCVESTPTGSSYELRRYELKKI